MPEVPGNRRRATFWQVGLAFWVMTAGAASAPLGPFRDHTDRPDGGSLLGSGGTVDQFYVVNARVRPLYLFWIGRDDVGGGRITWREDPDGARTVELLVGSDPARVPRQINRWGFIRERIRNGTTSVLGVMRESSEETIEEAEARVERERAGGGTFKAVRATIAGDRSASGAITLQTPTAFTYHQLDSVLALMPGEPAQPRITMLPPGTQHGFLQGMTAIVAASLDPCQRNGRAAPRAIPRVPYIYSHTIHDLTVVSCGFTRELRAKPATYSNVVEARFMSTNRSTGEVTKFEVAFGTTGPERGRPVRMVFRPRWWIEFEMLATPHPVEATR